MEKKKGISHMPYFVPSLSSTTVADWRLRNMVYEGKGEKYISLMFSEFYLWLFKIFIYLFLASLGLSGCVDFL